MPYPNEHSCRLQPPTGFKRWGRKNWPGKGSQEHEGKGIDVVYGVTVKDGKDTPVVQALRYPVKRWTAAAASAHCRSRKGAFEAAKKAETTAASAIYRAVAPLIAHLQAGGTKQYLKEIVRVGQFKHPDADKPHVVTPDRLKRWADTIKAMLAAGIKIPIPLTHAEALNPEKNRGWLRDGFVEDDRLVGILEITDDDPDTLAANSDVSIFAVPKFTDSQGTVYKDAILHIALCTDPLVPGLGEFVPMVASRNAGIEEVPIYIQQEKEENVMDLKKVQEAFSLAETPTTDTVEGVVLAAHTKLRTENTAMQAKLKTTETELKTVKAQTTIPKEPDPEVLRLASQNRTMKLDALVAGAHITPAVRDKLHAAYIGKDNSALKASLMAGTAGVLDLVIEALRDNDPVKLGEQTGAQTTELSRAFDGKTEETSEDLEKRKESVR